MNTLYSGISDKGFHAIMEAIYLDWVNNYATVMAFANAYGITESQAKVIIEIGKQGNIWK